MNINQFLNTVGGTIKEIDGEKGVWFDGPPEAPENALFIPLDDLGYSKSNGIFRKSLRPNFKSQLRV